MGRKAIIQTGGAILLGCNVAIPMVLDAQGLFPNWPYQYHELIGFLVFAIFVGWIIYSKQSHINRLESGRPELTLGRTIGIVRREFDEKTSTIKIELSISFRNIGIKSAYQFHSRIGLAPDNAPNKFELLDEETSVNRIDPNNDFEISHTLSGFVKYKEKDGKKVIPQTYTIIHCLVNYSDSPSDGEFYKDEWWLSYRADKGNFDMVSQRQKDALEPYVRMAYKQVESNR